LEVRGIYGAPFRFAVAHARGLVSARRISPRQAEGTQFTRPEDF